MNKNIFKSKVIYCLIIAFSSVNISFAAPAPIITSTQDKKNKEDHSFGLGFTASVAKRPFLGVNDQNTTLPYISYKYKNFYIEGTDAGFNFINNKTYNLDALITPRYYEVKSSFASDGELNGIDSTKPTYFTGISSQIHTESLTYTFQLLHDSSESNGNEIVIQASKSFQPINTLSIIPSFGLTYQDSNLVDHFYGVQSNEVVSGRPLYAGKSSVNYNATINAVWNITKHVELLGQIKYETLGKGITDSPIVDEKTINSFTMGAVYRF